jgi:hypothetical protein
MTTTIIVGVVCFMVGCTFGFLAATAFAVAKQADADCEEFFGSFEESDHTAMIRG